MEHAARQYWDRIALRWRIAEPLAPGTEDRLWFEREVARLEAQPPRALLLGVTAGIATMRWPRGTRLTAADWSSGMLKIVWPAKGTPPDTAVLCADWRALPLASASQDVVVGDGCYSTLTGMASMDALNGELHRVLRAGGRLLMRCFCRPDAGLRVSALFDDLLGGRIRNLDLFRWLLAMAVHGASRNGVTLKEVWAVWQRHVPDARALQSRLGWPEDGVRNMERWADSVMSYSFLTLRELQELAGTRFRVLACDTPTYEHGALFPRLHLAALA